VLSNLYIITDSSHSDTSLTPGSLQNRKIKLYNQWLLSWRRSHTDEFPHIAAAERYYLAIPASEVAVERLFNKGRDLLGLRRHSLNAETMRKLILLRDMYIRKETS
jgi:hypothetical protein